LHQLGRLNKILSSEWLDSFPQSAAKKEGLALLAFHIAGVRNIIADALSRDKPMSSEWILDKKSFLWICGLSPHP